MIQLLRHENLLYRNKPVCSRTRVVHKAKLITTYGPCVVRIIDLVTFYGKVILKGPRFKQRVVKDSVCLVFFHKN